MLNITKPVEENYLALLWTIAPDALFEQYNYGVPLLDEAKIELKEDIKNILSAAVSLDSDQKKLKKERINGSLVAQCAKEAVKYGIDHGLSINEIISVISKWKDTRKKRILLNKLALAEDWYLSPDIIMSRLGLFNNKNLPQNNESAA